MCGARALAPFPTPCSSRLKDMDESFFPWLQSFFPWLRCPHLQHSQGIPGSGAREVTWPGRACLRALPLLGAWRVLPGHTCLCFPWGGSHDLCGPQGQTRVKPVPPACGHSPGGHIVTRQPKAFPPWEAPPLAFNRPGWERQGASGGVASRSQWPPGAQPPHWADWNAWLGWTAPPTPAGNHVPPSPLGACSWGPGGSRHTDSPVCTRRPILGAPSRPAGFFASSLLAHLQAWLSSLLTHSMGPGY